MRKFTKSISFLLLASSLFSVSCSEKKEEAASAPQGMPPRNVEATKVARSTMTNILSLVGSVEANETADIRAEISGNLESIHFKEGQKVKAGQLLAKIDDREIAAQLTETEAQLKLAKQTRDRYLRLIENRAIPQADLDQAESSLSTLNATAKRLRVRLSKTVIIAPFDGTVGARNVSPGDYIDQSKSITNVIDTSKLKINFQVPERYYAQLEQGGRIDIRSSTTNGSKTSGSIYFISTVIDQATRSTQVKAWIENPPKSLFPGMFTNVDLILEVRENVLVVPEQALLASPQGDALVVIGEGQDGAHPVTITPVRTGLRNIGIVEVAPLQPDSIKEGTQIVAAGVGALPLFPGAQVIPLPMRPDPIRTGSTLQTGSYEEILNPPSRDKTEEQSEPKSEAPAPEQNGEEQ
ncbi:efflux RND transporter periplasmic adaptor subunit [Rubritalea spongiae]|uniref:Efflux RND transporter periplasmic adaptor subunit n=1 Tax=Rubritalea spongiae TaxID=430797 RepID=A0ABW5E405_9BACT